MISMEEVQKEEEEHQLNHVQDAEENDSLSYEWVNENMCETKVAVEDFIDATMWQTSFLGEEVARDVKFEATTSDELVSYSEQPDEAQLVELDTINPEDVIKNIDVIQITKSKNCKATARWILEQEGCPRVYKEKSQTEKGFKMACHLLNIGVKKMKELDQKACKNKRRKGYFHFRSLPFVFPPWRDEKIWAKANVELYAKMKEQREAEETRKRELRLSLVAKEEQLKKLKAERELAPNQDFIKICEISRKRKKIADLELRKAQMELKDVTKAHEYYSEKLFHVRKDKKRKLNLSTYYKRRLETVSSLGKNALNASRQNAATKELLDYETERLKTVKSDRNLLEEEQTELLGELEDLRETAYFDAMSEAAGQSWQLGDSSEKTGGDDKPTAKRKYRPEVIDVIGELLEIGLPIESAQSVFECVFESLDVPVRRFPNPAAIKRECSRNKRKLSN